MIYLHLFAFFLKTVFWIFFFFFQTQCMTKMFKLNSLQLSGVLISISRKANKVNIWLMDELHTNEGERKGLLLNFVSWYYYWCTSVSDSCMSACTTLFFCFSVLFFLFFCRATVVVKLHRQSFSIKRKRLLRQFRRAQLVIGEFAVLHLGRKRNNPCPHGQK